MERGREEVSKKTPAFVMRIRRMAQLTGHDQPGIGSLASAESVIAGARSLGVPAAEIAEGLDKRIHEIKRPLDAEVGNAQS